MTEKFKKFIDDFLNGTLIIPEKEYISMTYNEQIDNNLLIEEGLIISYDVTFLIKWLKSQKYISNIVVETDDFKITNQIIIELNENEGLSELTNMLNTYGYFISKNYITPKQIRRIEIEAKFPQKLNYDNNIKYLYHVAPKGLMEKIKQIGLVPKNSRRKDFLYEQSRIYFLITREPNKYLPKLSEQLFSSSENQENNVNFLKYHAKSPDDYTWFRIEMNNIFPKAIYFDPKFMLNAKDCFGVFTLQNIPPSALEIIKE